VAVRVPVEWTLDGGRGSSASGPRGSLRPESCASRDRFGLRGCLQRVGRVPRKVAREARRQQGVDLNALHPDSLSKQQCSGESLGFRSKAFGAFRSVDTKEPDPNRAAVSRKSHINGVAIDNRRNHPVEGLPCEALGPGVSPHRDGCACQQEHTDTNAKCPAPRERCLQAHGRHSSATANQRCRMLTCGFTWVLR
jgi:hypothetical protein